MSLSLKFKRNKKTKNLTRRLKNRQIFGDRINSISEVPREVLGSLGHDEVKG